MDNFAKRVKARRKKLGLSQAEVATLSGLKQPDVSKIELGQINQTTQILGLAKALKCNPDWLKTGEGPIEGPILGTTYTFIPGEASGGSSSNQAIALIGRAGRAIEIEDIDNHPDYAPVRRVNIKAQAGVSGFSVEYVHDDDKPPIFFRRDWYRAKGFAPDRMIAVRVTGESMIPTLHPDDLIVINTAQTQPQHSKTFLVSYEGEIVVKRLVRDDGQWWLTSDNPDQRRYPRVKCNGETQIIGEVVYRQTEVI